MKRQCPKGYTMVNGVCTETLSTIPGGGSGPPTLHCESLCQSYLPGSCQNDCSCSCCYSYWVETTGGGTWDPWVQAEHHCNCGGCMSEYWSCIAMCFSNWNINPQIGGYHGMGDGGGSRTGWRKGGKIKRRGRR